MNNADRLTRLLRPRSLAIVGGKAAEEAVRQCRALGYAGAIWPVNPKRAEMGGLPCFADMASLPDAPDAVFMAAPAPATIALAGELSGVGGAICYAAGFAESGDEGRERQEALLAAAGGVPLIGPNCYGMLNLFDRVALWPISMVACPSMRDAVSRLSVRAAIWRSTSQCRRADCRLAT